MTSPAAGSSNRRFISGNSTAEVHARANVRAVGVAETASGVDATGGLAGRVAGAAAAVDVAVGVDVAVAVDVDGTEPGTDEAEQPVDVAAPSARAAAGNTILTRRCILHLR
jgi:hypothetical protein